MKKILLSFCTGIAILCGCTGVPTNDGDIRYHSTRIFHPIGKYTCYDFTDHIVPQEFQKISARLDTHFNGQEILFTLSILDEDQVIQTVQEKATVREKDGNIVITPEKIEFPPALIAKYAFRDTANSLSSANGNLRSPLIEVSLYSEKYGNRIPQGEKYHAVFYSYDNGQVWTWQERKQQKYKDVGCVLRSITSMNDIFVGAILQK